MKDTITQIVEDVFNELPHGRVASWGSMMKTMLGLVASGGDGDHLEIGVMHGGTLIAAALLKKRMGLGGTVFGIDPLEGYYPASPTKPGGVFKTNGDLLTCSTDRVTGVPVNEKVLWENIRYFGVEDRIVVVKAFSYPFPFELRNRVFSTAYIDGDHYGGGPLRDWWSVHPLISVGGLVWFDDCNETCPAVQAAAQEAAVTPGWKTIGWYQNHCFVVGRE